MSERCCELSEAAEEPLAGTAVTAQSWLLVEVPGGWAKDVGAGEGLPEPAREAISAWLAETAGRRVHFVRRPARSGPGGLAFRVEAGEDRREVRRIELEAVEDLAAVDLTSAGEAVEGSLVLVCGHGSRDRCCALRGTAVFAALEERLGGEELWISSHQGGHRFAANVLVLPDGLQFGRVAPSEAPFLVARALGGRIELARYRGRTCFQPSVQAADVAIRRAAGLEGVRDLRLAGVADGTVGFRSPDGRAWTAAVEDVDGPVVPASCGAEPAAQTVRVARVV